jgi:hypothetical protein
MNREEEIRAKALEIAVKMFAALPKEFVLDQIENKGLSAEQIIINSAISFDIYIKS